MALEQEKHVMLSGTPRSISVTERTPISEILRRGRLRMTVFGDRSSLGNRQSAFGIRQSEIAITRARAWRAGS